MRKFSWSIIGLLALSIFANSQALQAQSALRPPWWTARGPVPSPTPKPPAALVTPAPEPPPPAESPYRRPWWWTARGPMKVEAAVTAKTTVPSQSGNPNPPTTFVTPPPALPRDDFQSVAPSPPADVVASAQDTALFLAGIPVSPKSPLAPLTNSVSWQAHSAHFEDAFAKLKRRQLSKLHAWQNAFLPESKEPVPVVFYMFSGPDFLYVDQFFPGASTYILCGQESMGPPPDPLRVTNLSSALHNLELAMHSSLTTSYFITKDMKVDLHRQELNGTLPIFYVFLARAGKTINQITYISLNRNGTFQENAPGMGGTPGVRIGYTDNLSKKKQTLFYFTTDISDAGISANPGFMNFCHSYGLGASFLKSSSYLMFEAGFAKVRDFILNHSEMIVQDDSGIPLANFNREKWNLRFFGTYSGPIELFRQHYQPNLQELFQQTNPPLLGISFGYHYNNRKSNLIVAERNETVLKE